MVPGRRRARAAASFRNDPKTDVKSLLFPTRTLLRVAMAFLSVAGVLAWAESHVPVENGTIAWYGRMFTGMPTASGEPFDPDALTMAHRTLPFGTRVRVTNLGNAQQVIVTVNDRGPFVAGRIADVSLAAARQLKMVRAGIARARLEILGRERPAK